MTSALELLLILVLTKRYRPQTIKGDCWCAGDVFSSPVSVGGSIFVGCRDDYLYKLSFV